MNKSAEFLGITDSQWGYFRHWFILLLCAEGLMLIFNKLIVQMYLSVAVLFLVGFFLRAFHLYPGQKEPLVLDFSAVCLACVYSSLGNWLIDSPWRFLLILCSSIIIIPHFVYIVKEK